MEHILVGLSSAPSNARVIRSAAAMAAAFGCRFTALYVRTPIYEVMGAEERQCLHRNTELAQNLGATVETVIGEDAAYQLAEYARLSKITRIVLGQSAARKYPWSKPTLTERLTAVSHDIDIHIIADADKPHRVKTAKEKLSEQKLFRDIFVVLGVLFLATLIAGGFSYLGFAEANIITVYLLAVPLASSITSTKSAYVLAALGSVMIFSFLFASPIFSFKVYAQGYPITCVLLLVTSVAVGTLTDRQARHSKQAAQAAYRTNLLLETNQLLQKTQSDSGIMQVAQMQISKLLDRDVTAVRGVVGRSQKDMLLYPVKVHERVYGTVLIKGSTPVEAFENSVLLSILGECALALENSRNAREKEETKVQAENEKLRANLLRTISHDLRTPLTSISGNASILLTDAENFDEETKKRIYTDIYEDAAFLYSLVENLLAVTKIEEGRLQLQTQHQLLEEIVSEALQHVRYKKTEHTLTVNHQDDLLLAKCDARMIVQVLINLVDNAIKYTPSGSHIRICTRPENGMAVVSVADDGGGIADDEKEKIFHMFYKGSSAVADSRRSLGLGLGLCKSIVEAHGGEISVADNLPHGTIFTFTLPSKEVQLHD